MKSTLIALAVIVVGFLGYVAVKPGKMRVSREITINAPVEIVFANVNDMHKMNAWNPWMKLDPQIKTTYSGPETGVGSSSSWEGNMEVGSGSATITESVPNTRIILALEHLKPFKSSNHAEYLFKSEGAQTKIVWTLECENSFIPKLFGVFMNMEKMMGEMFEKGLAELKIMSEMSVK